MTFARLFFLPASLLLGAALLLVATEYAVALPSRRTADIPYIDPQASDFDSERHRLDVYAPRKRPAVPLPVVVFIHGGNWNSGRKDIYRFIGRRLAGQGVVAVIINYRLAPQVLVPAMADDCARAVLWAQRHIAEYGGDRQRIFTMGHSAGGGLAALLAVNNELFARHGQPQNPVRGAILDDPAGLNMHSYLLKMQYPGDERFYTSFGRDSSVWRQVSPYHHLTRQSSPFLIFVGGETYPSIISSSEEFRQRLRALGHQPGYTLQPGKKHVPMVLQLYWRRNIIYRQLLPFIGAEPKYSAAAN